MKNDCTIIIYFCGNNVYASQLYMVSTGLHEEFGTIV